MPLSFNALLTQSDIDPAGVLLLRHRDPKVHRQLYAAALSSDPRFEDYQRSQSTPQVLQKFERATHLAGFVAGFSGECVFVGVWKLGGPSGEVYRDPFPGMAPNEGAVVMFETERVLAFDTYRGRLVVDWGKGFLAWAQWAGRGDKEIVELRREAVDPPFPGYMQFGCALDQVDAQPTAWVSALQAVGGVYLLVRRETGEMYVGSASGAEGFLGRWRNYQNGHGGNVGLRELGGEAADFDVSILETAGSAIGAEGVLQLEARWKEKLGTRVRGLNRN